MKAKVLKYKFDGNTVVAPYMELEPYAENVYLSLSRKNEYGNEDDDCFHVVCRIENVYFSSGQYSRRFLNGENRLELICPIKDEVKVWNEFTPTLYTLRASIQTDPYKDTQEIKFGFRDLEKNGPALLLNDQKIVSIR